MGVETATLMAVGSLALGAASTGYSIYANEQKNKKQKKLQQYQNQLIQQEQEQENEKRIELINQQRYQLASSFKDLNPYSINQTSALGRKNNLLG